MRVLADPAALPEFQYTVDPNTLELKAALDAIRHCPDLEKLVQHATARHGYQNDDGYFGVTYPGDLEPGEDLADGYVLAQAGYGDSDAPERPLLESMYLELLGRYLEVRERPDLAAKVAALIVAFERA